MTATLDTLFREGLGLPPDQRVSLARQLLDSVEPEPEPGAEAAGEAEAARRLERYHSGESPSIPAAEVFARLRKIAPGA
jgi:putative addiction module component (TIGR02574 family)